VRVSEGGRRGKKVMMIVKGTVGVKSNRKREKVKKEGKIGALNR